MTRPTFFLVPVAAALLVVGALSLSAQSSEPVDLDAIFTLKDEGFERSKVMDAAWWLTEVHGPRLTNSPQMRAAADWAVKKLNESGLAITGGTDHLGFNEVGLSGFQFIQDPVQYSSRTHHSNLDVYDQLIASDMMKNAVMTASFVYHIANREQMLPRKALPKPAKPTTTTAGR